VSSSIANNRFEILRLLDAGLRHTLLPQSFASEGVLCGKECEIDLCCIAFAILVNNTDVALVHADKLILWSEAREGEVGVLTCNQVSHVESVVLQFGCSTPDLTSEKMKLQAVLVKFASWVRNWVKSLVVDEKYAPT
jgi:hypothetical protein